MLKANISSLFKTIAALSIITLLLTIGLLITMIVRGHRSFPSSAPVGTYFQRKYSTRTDIGIKLRISFISVTIFCLAILIILVFKANCQQGESDAWTDIRKPIFILISICLLALLPVAPFYGSIFIQRYKVSKQAYWDEISVFAQGILSLILMVIGWIAVTYHLLTEENEKAASQRELERDQEENINKELFNMQKSLQQDRQANQKGALYENLFDKIRDNPMEDFKQGQQENNSIIKSMMKRQREEYKNYDSKGAKGKPKQKMEKLSRKQQAVRIQRQLLKEEIEKRKKRFRQINPHSAHQHTEDASQISQQSQQDHKMANLPKTYKQYIKQAKRPKRGAPVIDQLIKQVGTALLEKSIYQSQVDYQEGMVRQIAPILIQELGGQTANMDGENEQNPNFSKLQAKIRQYRKKKLNDVKGMQAEEQLVSTNDLFKKCDKKKLFQETVIMGNVANRINFDNFEFETQAPKRRRKAQPTREQQIIVKLKDRYGAQQANAI